MKNRNNQIKPDQKILDAFPEEDRDVISRIWEMAEPPEAAGGPANAERPEAKEGHVDAEHRPDGGELREQREEHAKQYRGVAGILDNEELEQEWKKLQQRINYRSQPVIRRIYPYVAVAVAALLLAGFIGWYFFVPVTIEAPRGMFTTHTWPDGVQVELNSGSQISWKRSLGDGHRQVTLEGEAFFDVPGGEGEFVVNTHNAQIRVYGTRFNVRSWKDDPDAETLLTLVSGEVALSSRDQPDETVLLHSGEWSRIDRSRTIPYEPEEVDTTRALSWRNDGFYFQAAGLPKVVAELERRFNTQIEIEDPSLNDRKLTLYLPTSQELESIVESVCHLTGCRYAGENGNMRIY